MKPGTSDRGLKAAVIRQTRHHCASARVVGGARIISALLGLAGPVAVGTAVGHPQAGIVAGLGGMAVGGAGMDASAPRQWPELLYRLSAGTLAMATGTAIAGHGLLTAGALPAVAAVAGLFGGISRPLARAAVLFILYTVLAASVGTGGEHPVGMLVMFAAGAIWTACTALALQLLLRTPVPDATLNRDMAPALAPRYTAAQRLRRWRYSLKHRSGWQYPLRITLCLAVAEALQWVWPLDHGYWVSITVVVVVHPNIQAALKRTLQRAAGTALGVALISLLMSGSSPEWVAVVLIALFAALRPIFLQSNYTAYATVHTPLIILLLEFGRPPSWTLAIDRLSATLAGCAVSLTLGYLLWIKFFASRHLDSGTGRLSAATWSQTHGAS